MFFYVLIATVRLALLVLKLCMLARALFSFFPSDDNPLLALLAFITEPVIYPVRALCDRFGIGDGLPIDIPFFITFVILSVISAVL